MNNTFETKQEALEHLRENPTACVQWGEMCAIYWNDKISVQRVDRKKDWWN